MIPLMSETARSWLASVEGLPPEQIQERAVTAAQTGLLSFADALAIKALADRVSNSVKGLPAAGNVMSDMQQQIQSALAPQAQPTQAMAGGGIVAFYEGGSPLYAYGARGGNLGVDYPYSPTTPFPDIFGGIFTGAPTPVPRGSRPTVPPSAPMGAAAPLDAGVPPPAPAPVPAAPAPAGLGSLFDPLINAAKDARGVAPDLAAEEASAKERFKGLQDLLDKQDKELEKRGATLNERTAGQERLLHAMLGFNMAAAASQPGATFLGSAATAGADFAKNKMALNEETAKRADALADSRLELERASAKLGIDASEGAYQRYNDKLAIYQQANNRYEDILLAQANAEAAQSTALSAASVKGGIKMAELQAEAVMKAMDSDQMSSILQAMATAENELASGQLNEYEAEQRKAELQRLAGQRAALIGPYTGTAGTGGVWMPSSDGSLVRRGN